jgi:hypothetical protein
MLIRKTNSKDFSKFKKEFLKLLEKEDFPKIDVPDWGTLEECEIYIKNSITEGNQVIEAKFIYGDSQINEELVKIKDKYCTQNKFERIICFQKLYFDQYYKQRKIGKIKNVKYGHGGTRDFMFITWFSNLLDIMEDKKINFEDNFPQSYKSLNQLHDRKILNHKEYKKYCEDINVVLMLRNQVLLNNKNGKFEGLTYLDEPTIDELNKKGMFAGLFNSKKELKKYLENAIDGVKKLKDYIWKNYLNHLGKTKGYEWYENFREILKGDIDSKMLKKIESNDVFSKVAIVWNLSPTEHKEIFNEVFEKYSDSDNWEILASICCHAKCPSKILDKIVKNKAMEKGYEYLLRISSRNKNTKEKTLLRIINNPVLEERFKIVAKTTYKNGVKKANESR